MLGEGLVDGREEPVTEDPADELGDAPAAGLDRPAEGALEEARRGSGCAERRSARVARA
jgi:hypothetical protein